VLSEVSQNLAEEEEELHGALVSASGFYWLCLQTKIVTLFSLYETRKHPESANSVKPKDHAVANRRNALYR